MYNVKTLEKMQFDDRKSLRQLNNSRSKSKEKDLDSINSSRLSLFQMKSAQGPRLNKYNSQQLLDQLSQKSDRSIQSRGGERIYIDERQSSKLNKMMKQLDHAVEKLQNQRQLTENQLLNQKNINNIKLQSLKQNESTSVFTRTESQQSFLSTMNNSQQNVLDKELQDKIKFLNSLYDQVKKKKLKIQDQQRDLERLNPQNVDILENEHKILLNEISTLENTIEIDQLTSRQLKHMLKVRSKEKEIIYQPYHSMQAQIKQVQKEIILKQNNLKQLIDEAKKFNREFLKVQMFTLQNKSKLQIILNEKIRVQEEEQMIQNHIQMELEQMEQIRKNQALNKKNLQDEKNEQIKQQQLQILNEYSIKEQQMNSLMDQFVQIKSKVPHLKDLSELQSYYDKSKDINQSLQIEVKNLEEQILQNKNLLSDLKNQQNQLLIQQKIKQKEQIQENECSEEEDINTKLEDFQIKNQNSIKKIQQYTHIYQEVIRFCSQIQSKILNLDVFQNQEIIPQFELNEKTLYNPTPYLEILSININNIINKNSDIK